MTETMESLLAVLLFSILSESTVHLCALCSISLWILLIKYLVTWPVYMLGLQNTTSCACVCARARACVCVCEGQMCKYICIEPVIFTTGWNESTANSWVSLYLLCPCLRSLTLSSAVPQHPLLKTRLTKSQSVPYSKQPHLESSPEMFTAECWLQLLWTQCSTLGLENTAINLLWKRTL